MHLHCRRQETVAGRNSSIKSAGVKGLSEVGRKSKKCLEREELIYGVHWLTQEGVQPRLSHRTPNSEGS